MPESLFDALSHGDFFPCAYSGDADHLFRLMPITQTGDADHSFRFIAVMRERDNAGNKIIPLVVVWVQRGMNFSHRFSLRF
jgi:hypothetical protein